MTSARGVDYLAMRPLLRDFTVAMPAVRQSSIRRMQR